MDKKEVERRGQERERKDKGRKGGDSSREWENTGERSNHVCPAEVTTGLQVLIMC